MRTVVLVAVLALLGAARDAAAAGPRVALVQVTPPAGSKITAATRLQLVAEYSWPDFQRGWDKVVFSYVLTRKASGRLRELTVKQTDGRLTVEVLAVEIGLVEVPGRPDQHMPYAGPLELRAELVHRALREIPVTVKTSDKVSFTADLGDYRGHKLQIIRPSDGRTQIAIDPNQEPYRPRLPPALNREGMVVWGLFKVCVDSEAHVFSVNVLKSADALVDDDWMSLLRTWRYRPYLVDGVASPFCYPLRLEVRSAG